MLIIAPMPLPLIVELRELGRALLDLLHVDLHLETAEAERDLDIRGPAGSSWMSKLSTPGIVFAIVAGSFSTFQTVRFEVREGAVAVHSCVHHGNAAACFADPRASPTRGGTDCSCWFTIGLRRTRGGAHRADRPGDIVYDSWNPYKRVWKLLQASGAVA